MTCIDNLSAPIDCAMHVHLPMKKGMLMMPVTDGICSFASSAVAALDWLKLVHFTRRPQLDFSVLSVMCALTSGVVDLHRRATSLNVQSGISVISAYNAANCFELAHC